MNYDTYLEIDQDSDSGFPGLPGRTYKKRRHDEKIPSQKTLTGSFTVLRQKSTTSMGELSRPLCTSMTRLRDNPVSWWPPGPVDLSLL